MINHKFIILCITERQGIFHYCLQSITKRHAFENSRHDDAITWNGYCLLDDINCVGVEILGYASPARGVS